MGSMHARFKAGGATVKLFSDCVAVCSGDPLSATLIVKLKVPSAVGVPVIAPVDVFSVSPAGSVPELMA